MQRNTIAPQIFSSQVFPTYSFFVLFETKEFLYNKKRKSRLFMMKFIKQKGTLQNKYKNNN